MTRRTTHERRQAAEIADATVVVVVRRSEYSAPRWPRCQATRTDRDHPACVVAGTAPGHGIIPRTIRGASVHASPFRDLYHSDKQGYWRDVGIVDHRGTKSGVTPVTREMLEG